MSEAEGLRPGRVILGRYVLEHELGRGGMGSVHAARGPQGEAVAVKVVGLGEGGSWKGRELFERSCRVLRGLEHEGLPRVHAFGELDDGSLALVRDRFDGGTLRSWVEQEHWRPSAADVRTLLEGLLRVLVYLHGRVPPVVHRDIKPSNVMFGRGPSERGAVGSAVLVDFDTVAAAPGSAAEGHTLIISPGFTAPEQLAGATSPSSDLYALGMTMLFVVSHREPDTLRRDEDGRIELGSMLDGLDPRSREVLRSMIEPARRDRPRSAQEALERLRGSGGERARTGARALGALAAPSDGQLAALTEDPPPARAAVPRPLIAVAMVGVALLLMVAVAMAVVGSAEEASGLEDEVEARQAEAEAEAEAEVEGAEGAAGARAGVEASAVVEPELRCPEGRADCNGERDDGCETTLATTAAHCGACDRACTEPQRCDAGECIAAAIRADATSSDLCELRRDGSLWCSRGRGAPLRRVELPRPVLAFDLEDHACAITDEHRLYCWGPNSVGQAATGSGRKEEPTPVLIEGLQEVSAVALGRTSGCAVAEGRAHCWGSALSFATLGSRTAYGSDVPIPVRGMDEIDAMGAGPMNTCVVRSGGVWCWGDGRSGVPGDPKRPQGSEPTRIEALDDAVAVAVGRDHACALRSTGQVACWGTNARGQLGDGTLEDRFTPVTLPLEGIEQLAIDDDRSCARDQSTVWCWGGAPDEGPSVVSVPGSPRSIAVDGWRLVVVLDDGRVVLQPVRRGY